MGARAAPGHSWGAQSKIVKGVVVLGDRRGCAYMDHSQRVCMWDPQCKGFLKQASTHTSSPLLSVSVTHAHTKHTGAWGSHSIIHSPIQNRYAPWLATGSLDSGGIENGPCTQLGVPHGEWMQKQMEGRRGCGENHKTKTKPRDQKVRQELRVILGGLATRNGGWLVVDSPHHRTGCC